MRELVMLQSEQALAIILHECIRSVHRLEMEHDNRCISDVGTSIPTVSLNA